MGWPEPFFISIPWEPPSSNLRRILIPDNLKSLRTPDPPLLSQTQGIEKSEHGPVVMPEVQRPPSSFWSFGVSRNWVRWEGPEVGLGKVVL